MLNLHDFGLATKFHRRERSREKLPSCKKSTKSCPPLSSFCLIIQLFSYQFQNCTPQLHSLYQKFQTINKGKENLSVSYPMDDYKRTHIPAFGNWDYDQSSPITQYFESARQAGLLRYNYREGDVYSYIGQYEQDRDLYMQPTHTVAVAPPRRRSKTNEAQEKKSHVYYEAPHVKEQKKQRKVYDVEQTARQQQHRVGRNDGRAPKAVDEDLYKIPPELLYSKKKKAFGFFSRCLVPSCAA